jgi:hypothetical protein
MNGTAKSEQKVSYIVFFLPMTYIGAHAKYADRQRVIETVTSALRAGSSPNHDDGYVVDWQWDAKNAEATRNHCFGQLYPIGEIYQSFSVSCDYGLTDPAIYRRQHCWRIDRT